MSSAYASGGQSDSSKGNLVALLTWLGYLWKLKSGNPLTEAHHFTRRARRLKSALRMKDEVNNTSQSIYSPCQWMGPRSMRRLSKRLSHGVNNHSEIVRIYNRSLMSCALWWVWRSLFSLTTTLPLVFLQSFFLGLDRSNADVWYYCTYMRVVNW